MGESNDKPSNTSPPPTVSPSKRNADEKIKDTFLFNVVDVLSDVEDFVFKTVSNPFRNQSQGKNCENA